MKTAFSLLLCTLIAAEVFAFGDFKVKLRIEMVDHQPATGTSIRVLHKNKEIMKEMAPEDGDINIKLDDGRLYEIWIERPGYLSHVIHNVHKEGDGKFKVTMYRSTSKVQSRNTDYTGVFRTIDDVKKMTIPDEYLAEGVDVVNEDALTPDEQKELKKLKKLAKSQEKSQKKIDKLLDKKVDLEKNMADKEESFRAGEMTQIEIEEARLKHQKSVVKLQQKLDKLAY